MVNLINRKVKNLALKKSIKKEIFDGIGFSLILILICMILLSNVVRVINKGLENYKVYEYEKSLLEEAQKKNEVLSDEYEYYSSDETKKLLAREILNLGQSNETLYSIKENITFYEQEKKIIEVKDENLRSWWSSLINI